MVGRDVKDANGAALQKRVERAPAEKSEQRAFGASAATHSAPFIRTFSVGTR